MNGFPLLFAKAGKTYKIEKIIDSGSVARRLQDLGFTFGTEIVVDSITKNGVVVKIKDTKLALGSDLISKIYISEQTKQKAQEL